MVGPGVRGLGDLLAELAPVPPTQVAELRRLDGDTFVRTPRADETPC